MWPAKKPIKFKTCVEEFLHRIRHAPIHDEFEFYIKIFAFWFETVVLEFRWNFLSLSKKKSTNKRSRIILQMDTSTYVRLIGWKGF